MRSSAGCALLLVGLFVLGRPPAGLSQSPRPESGTDPAKIVLIRQVIAVAQAADQAVLAMEAGLPAQRASNPRIPAVFWDRFAERVRTRRADFVELLVPAPTGGGSEMGHAPGVEIGQELAAEGIQIQP